MGAAPSSSVAAAEALCSHFPRHSLKSRKQRKQRKGKNFLERLFDVGGEKQVRKTSLKRAKSKNTDRDSARSMTVSVSSFSTGISGSVPLRNTGFRRDPAHVDSQGSKRGGRSEAIMCPPPTIIEVVHQDECEADRRMREKMYARATWRMYDRIMTARMKSTTQQHTLSTRKGEKIGFVEDSLTSSEIDCSLGSCSPQHDGIFALDDDFNR